MADYKVPLWDIFFILEELADIASIGAYPGFPEYSDDMLEPVLSESAKFVEQTIAPLNVVGDRQGARRNDDGTVTTADGFIAAYEAYVKAGWGAVPFDPAYGGGGFPRVVALAVSEMLNSACMAFALCPLLTQGSIDLISHHGDETQREIWLSSLISGGWTATMNLTEPDAGSDVGALRTKATPAGDGTYLISGQKIFITYGDHDLAENIVHLVLARTPNAPPGTKGISTFIVPKFLLDDDGNPDVRNAVECTSIEHKLGIHGSPTCVLQFGDNDGNGAVGYLIGEENSGMSYMFTMMNNARLSVGMQGLAIAERAYQDAVAYAMERKQGRALGSPPGTSSPIIEHADVRRMLLTMKAYIEAMRGLGYIHAAAVDTAEHHPDSDERKAAFERDALLTPITKAWCTDLGCELTSIAVQVHGGMGFIEETGVAQHFRDARINPIYEGTNGIQALDLVARKLPMNGGQVITALLDEIEATAAEASSGGDALASMGTSLASSAATVRATTMKLLESMAADVLDGFAGATPYLSMLGQLLGGWSMVRQAQAAQRRLDAGEEDPRLSAKVTTADFYCEQLLPLVGAREAAVLAGAGPLMALPEELFSA